MRLYLRCKLSWYVATGLLLLMLSFVAALPVAAASTVAALEIQLMESERTGNQAEMIALLVQLSDAKVELGSYRESKSHLHRALTLTKTIGDLTLRANVLSRLADTCLVMGQTDLASTFLGEAFSLVEKSAPSGLKGAILINLGNLSAQKNDTDGALKYYRLAANEADKSGDTSVAANAMTNIARVMLNSGSSAEVWAALQAANEKTVALQDNDDKAFLQIALARLAREVNPGPASKRQELVQLEHKLLGNAIRIAESTHSPRLTSQAYGYLGELYADSGRYREAERLLLKAVFIANEVDASDILYLWQWQMGRLKVNEGRFDEAIQDYRNAMLTLQTVRPRINMGLHRQRGSFRETTGPLYYELADLLLRAPSEGESDVEIESRLLEARQTIELLKAVELQDYFQDNCVTELSSRTSGVDAIAPNTAVLYIVELPGRLELLLSLPQGIKQVTVPVTSNELQVEIGRFRRFLEKRTTRQYLRQARQLYNWMIKPIEPYLLENNIRTLVTVPQGSMTRIPFAALNDGKKFLIEKYALATTPGLSLTDPGSLKKAGASVLLAGLSEGVQGFAPLPNVPAELQSVVNVFGGDILQDQDFSYENMVKALEKVPYPVVHIASHAQFKGQSKDTFLLTWHEQIDLDGLESLIGLSEFRSQPVELLVLSACQTAAGDEQAALGLAGIAVKAGARSALASLWFVNDESTSHLITEFYKQFKKPGISKAEALQAAQIDTLMDPRYRHPGYWAPFLLIGNWL